jgi:tRNA A-37 threonylcarbamoyl transferase component Bud32
MTQLRENKPMSLRITGLGEEIGAVIGLPWERPLEDWPEDPNLAEKRGISRHVVRLVRADEEDSNSEIYAVKETVVEFAKREYKALIELKKLGAPSVEPIAVIEGRTNSVGEELPCAIATRFLPYSLPYRVVLSQSVSEHDINNMANALAYLLVQLHLLGFWWGDCSLSNTLFRRDAEGFAAYLVDAETGEFQTKLSDGQREHDLEIAFFNVAAELEDLQLSGVLYEGMDPIRASEAVQRRYRRLWSALKDPQKLDPNDRHAVERAMRQLHDLGFAVEEVQVALDNETHMLSFQPRLVAAGYHMAKLKSRFSLDAQELQAKRILASFDRWYARQTNKSSKDEMAKEWLDSVFFPILDMVPAELSGRVEKAQMFHEILENRWYMTEKAGYDVGLEVAAKAYFEDILPFRMDSGVETE